MKKVFHKVIAFLFFSIKKRSEKIKKASLTPVGRRIIIGFTCGIALFLLKPNLAYCIELPLEPLKKQNSRSWKEFFLENRYNLLHTVLPLTLRFGLSFGTLWVLRDAQRNFLKILADKQYKIEEQELLLRIITFVNEGCENIKKNSDDGYL